MRELDNLSVDECVTQIRTRAALVMEGVRELIDFHESNSIVLHSDLIKKQIPKSYAAHAFNNLRQAMLGFEISKVCALWDNAEIQKVSIPTLMAFLEKKGLAERLGEKAMEALLNVEAHFLNPTEDPDLKGLLAEITQRQKKSAAEREKANTENHLATATEIYQSTVSDNRFHAIRNHRDKFVAHKLLETRREQKAPVDEMKHGDQSWLLESTIAIASHLALGILATDWAWKQTREIAARYATALWGGCTFKVLE